MPIDLTHEGLNTPQNYRLYLSLAEIGLGIAVQTLSYNDVRRVLTPEGESAHVNGDSELGRAAQVPQHVLGRGQVLAERVRDALR